MLTRRSALFGLPLSAGRVARSGATASSGATRRQGQGEGCR